MDELGKKSDNVINVLYIFYNEKDCVFEILNEKSEDENSVELMFIETNDYEKMKLACIVALTSFKPALTSSGKGSIYVSPSVDFLFLQDLKNEEIFRNFNNNSLENL